MSADLDRWREIAHRAKPPTDNYWNEAEVLAAITEAVGVARSLQALPLDELQRLKLQVQTELERRIGGSPAEGVTVPTPKPFDWQE